MLRLDRLRALVDVYPGVEREDEMVAAFDYCLHGKGGAAPSIDTAMHGLVDAPHVDHLHPDSGIALATAADGEKLTEECFGDRVVWVPWRRPGLPARPGHRGDQGGQPAGHRRASSAGTGSPRGATTSDGGRGQLAGDHPHRAGVPRRARLGRAVRRRWCPAYEPLPEAERRAKAAAIFPTIRGHRLARTSRRSGTSPTADVVLEFLSREKLGPLAELGTSCPDHFLRTKVKPLVVDLPGTATVEEIVARLGELHAAYRADYQAYYDRNATPDSPRDARRRPGDRAGARRRACSPSARTSRPRGWPASSTSTRST